MKKKAILGLFAGCLAIGISLPVAAQTKEFSFILENGQYEILAPASKADSEQNYYVTQYFSGVGTGESPRTRYYSYYHKNRVSKPLNLKCDDFQRHFESYTFQAPTGDGYELFGEYVSGTGSRTSFISGRWTP